MRTGLFLTLALSFIAITGNPAQANPAQSMSQGSPYRWCALYGSPNNESCHFITLEKCRNFIAISGGACFPNVYFKEGASNSSAPSHTPATINRSTRS